MCGHQLTIHFAKTRWGVGYVSEKNDQDKYAKTILLTHYTKLCPYC